MCKRNVQSAATAMTLQLVRNSEVALVCAEREKLVIRQPPIGGKDDYDSENSWISDGLPSSSRRRRRGGGRWEVGEWRKK